MHSDGSQYAHRPAVVYLRERQVVEPRVGVLVAVLLAVFVLGVLVGRWV